MIQVNVRMKPEELEKAKAQAERLGITLSAYIRMLINTSEVTVKHHVDKKKIRR
jgi:antitoxin component of RelBE/YafQ-DinJ toxin-antitoxin module